jgi:hypothetical protein
MVWLRYLEDTFLHTEMPMWKTILALLRLGNASSNDDSIPVATLAPPVSKEPKKNGKVVTRIGKGRPDAPRIRKPPQASLPLTLTVVERSLVQGITLGSRVAVRRPLDRLVISSAALANLDQVGDGGEAVVYESPNGKAWKIFRLPTDPYYAGDDLEQEAGRKAATRRLAQYQRKFEQYPVWIGSRVIAPERLISIRECADYPIMGYEMPLLGDAVSLTKYYNKRWKKQNRVNTADIARMFLDLYDTLQELHACGMLIGDFKPHNLLVRDGKIFVIDSESAQFGDFGCDTFSEAYIDPQLCDPEQDCEIKCKPYTRTSDWYAFTASWFQALTNILPFSGVYTPPPGAPSVPQTARALKGISVFNRHVIIPEFYESIENSPRELQDYFFNVFERGYRAMPDRKLLEMLVKGPTPVFHPLQHTAWAKFPLDRTAGPAESSNLPQLLQVPRGRLKALSVFGGKACWLVVDNGSLLREDGTEVLRGVKSDDYNCFRVGPNVTLFGRVGQDRASDDKLFLFRPGSPSLNMLSRFDLMASTKKPNIGLVGDEPLWLEKGRLHRYRWDSPLTESLAEFQDHAWLFCGLKFAVIITFANDQFSELFIVHDGIAKRVVSLPPLMGVLRRASCHFSESAVWVFMSLERQGEAIHYLLVLSQDGNLLGMNAETDGRSTLHHNGAHRVAFEQTDNGRTKFRLAACYEQSLVTLTCQTDYHVTIEQLRDLQLPRPPARILYTPSQGLLYTTH